MKKKTRLLALGVAAGLIAWCVPFAVIPAQATPLAEAAQQNTLPPAAPNSQSGAEQQQQQRAQEQEEQQAQQSEMNQQSERSQQQQIELTGKVTQQNGHYLFLNSDTHKALRVSNPSKVKKYDGEMVKVEGTVNPKSHKLHVSKVTPATS
ncbi:MAG TPA: hypothetical protein VGY31_01180 [Terriglobia bacterium]|nr:hypothetical protein [Terriglobia bacterium]